MAGFDKGPILVTGAGGGIGAATVRHLIAAGARSDAVIAPLGDVLRLALLGDDALEGDQQR